MDSKGIGSGNDFFRTLSQIKHRDLTDGRLLGYENLAMMLISVDHSLS